MSGSPPHTHTFIKVLRGEVCTEVHPNHRRRLRCETRQARRLRGVKGGRTIYDTAVSGLPRPQRGRGDEETICLSPSAGNFSIRNKSSELFSFVCSALKKCQLFSLPHISPPPPLLPAAPDKPLGSRRCPRLLRGVNVCESWGEWGTQTYTDA